MTNLQDKINSEFYVKINPRGIDYSNFDIQYLGKYVENNLWSNKANFGILLEDKDKRKTELVGCFRNFWKKAQLTSPLEFDFELKDEDFILSPVLKDYLFSFFSSFSKIKFPEMEILDHYKGEFKEVYIKKKIPKNNSWRGLFVDLYSNNDSLIETLDDLSNQSKISIKENRHWMKYRNVRKYLQMLDERRNFMHFDSSEKEILEGKDLLSFLRKNYSSPSLKFKDGEDYKYFLLGFHKANFNVENIHKKVLHLFDDQNLLEEYVNEFISKAKRLNLFSNEYFNFNERYKFFGNGVNKDNLDNSFEEVMQRGNEIEIPHHIPKNLWDLGFFPLKRNRKKQKTKASYSFLKIKGSSPYPQQKTIPFEDFEDDIKLEDEDYTPDYGKYSEEELQF